MIITHLVTVEFLILHRIETVWLPEDSGLNILIHGQLKMSHTADPGSDLFSQIHFYADCYLLQLTAFPPKQPHLNCNIVWLKVYPMQQDIIATWAQKQFSGKFPPTEIKDNKLWVNSAWLWKSFPSLIVPTEVQHPPSAPFPEINYL